MSLFGGFDIRGTFLLRLRELRDPLRVRLFEAFGTLGRRVAHRFGSFGRGALENCDMGFVQRRDLLFVLGASFRKRPTTAFVDLFQLFCVFLLQVGDCGRLFLPKDLFELLESTASKKPFPTSY